MNVFITCGVSGSGKSTYLKANFPSFFIVSKDEIRKRLSNNFTIDVFEQDVFLTFKSEIALCCKKEIDFCVDAVFLSPRTRKDITSLIKKIQPKAVITFINVWCPLQVALAQNNKREGLERVPTNIVESMYKSFKPAALFEKNIDNIINVTSCRENEFQEYAKKQWKIKNSFDFLKKI